MIKLIELLIYAVPLAFIWVYSFVMLHKDMKRSDEVYKYLMDEYKKKR